MDKTFTDPDCNLDNNPIDVCKLPSLTSFEISRIVGVQQMDDELIYAKKFEWRFLVLPVQDLVFSKYDGCEPEGGWSECYLRFLKEDKLAVANGSPAYAGRDRWIKEQWCDNTHIYPLFLIDDPSGLKLLDGHHRLAGAFHYKLSSVAAFIGKPVATKRNKHERS